MLLFPHCLGLPMSSASLRCEEGTLRRLFSPLLYEQQQHLNSLSDGAWSGDRSRRRAGSCPQGDLEKKILWDSGWFCSATCSLVTVVLSCRAAVMFLEWSVD